MSELFRRPWIRQTILSFVAPTASLPSTTSSSVTRVAQIRSVSEKDPNYVLLADRDLCIWGILSPSVFEQLSSQRGKLGKLVGGFIQIIKFELIMLPCPRLGKTGTWPEIIDSNEKPELFLQILQAEFLGGDECLPAGEPSWYFSDGTIQNLIQNIPLGELNDRISSRQSIQMPDWIPDWDLNIACDLAEKLKLEKSQKVFIAPSEPPSQINESEENKEDEFPKGEVKLSTPHHLNKARKGTPSKLNDNVDKKLSSGKKNKETPSIFQTEKWLKRSVPELTSSAQKELSPKSATDNTPKKSEVKRDLKADFLTPSPSNKNDESLPRVSASEHAENIKAQAVFIVEQKTEPVLQKIPDSKQTTKLAVHFETQNINESIFENDILTEDEEEYNNEQPAENEMQGKNANQTRSFEIVGIKESESEASNQIQDGKSKKKQRRLGPMTQISSETFEEEEESEVQQVVEEHDHQVSALPRQNEDDESDLVSSLEIEQLRPLRPSRKLKFGKITKRFHKNPQMGIDESLKVDWVLETGLAALEGIKKGDIVLSAGGKNAFHDIRKVLESGPFPTIIELRTDAVDIIEEQEEYHTEEQKDEYVGVHFKEWWGGMLYTGYVESRLQGNAKDEEPRYRLHYSDNRRLERPLSFVKKLVSGELSRAHEHDASGKCLIEQKPETVIKDDQRSKSHPISSTPNHQHKKFKLDKIILFDDDCDADTALNLLARFKGKITRE